MYKERAKKPVMAEKAHSDAGNDKSRLPRYVYWGAVIGAVASLATLFIVVFFYGRTIGLATGDCTILSCVMTLLLSQPAGLAGIAAGTLVGALGGFLGHKLHS